MKKHVFALSLLLVRVVAPAQAQDCRLFELKKGTMLELTSFDAKQRPTGRTVQQVTALTSTGTTTTATLHQQHYDEKNKLLMEGDFTIECSGGTLKLDMRAMAAQQEQMQKSMKDMQIELTGNQLELPANPTVGATLPDGTMTMTATDKSSGLKMMQMTITMTDRQVAARETQTTPAGRYDCVRVTQSMKTENVAMGIPIRFELRSVEWYSPGVGPVRTETYRNDKLMGYTLLTKVQQ